MPEITEAVSILKDLVDSGKTLYVSDLWYPILVAAFPEAVAPELAGSAPLDALKGVDRTKYGDVQDVEAEVLDPSLRAMLGERLSLTFDARGWAPALFNGKQVVTLLRGRFKTVTGAERFDPLLVKFPAGKGTVIFTSFHNSKLLSDSGRKLLKGLVVVVTTARVEREMVETAVRGGLSLRHGGLLKASRGGESVQQTYSHRRRGRLKFLLGFEKGAGAELKLTVQGPDGAPQSRQGTESLEIEIPDAPAGDWSYTISIIKVPFDDFGYQLLIAE
jgi:hypothetical protein